MKQAIQKALGAFTLLILLGTAVSGCYEQHYYHEHHYHTGGWYHHHHEAPPPGVDIDIHN